MERKHLIRPIRAPSGRVHLRLLRQVADVQAGNGRGLAFELFVDAGLIFSNVLLPDPLTPSMPISAPGKNDRETPLRICVFGGTICPTRPMVKTHSVMGAGSFASRWTVDRSPSSRASRIPRGNPQAMAHICIPGEPIIQAACLSLHLFFTTGRLKTPHNTTCRLECIP